MKLSWGWDAKTPFSSWSLASSYHARKHDWNWETEALSDGTNSTYCSELSSYLAYHKQKKNSWRPRTKGHSHHGFRLLVRHAKSQLVVESVRTLVVYLIMSTLDNSINQLREWSFVLLLSVEGRPVVFSHCCQVKKENQKILAILPKKFCPVSFENILKLFLCRKNGDSKFEFRLARGIRKSVVLTITYCQL
jgi:hypothetical protein